MRENGAERMRENVANSASGERRSNCCCMVRESGAETSRAWRGERERETGKRCCVVEEIGGRRKWDFVQSFV